MGHYSLFEQSGTSERIPLEEFKILTREKIEENNRLTQNLWKLKRKLNRCNDPDVLRELNEQLIQTQKAIDKLNVQECLEALKKIELKTEGTSFIGCNSPFTI